MSRSSFHAWLNRLVGVLATHDAAIVIAIDKSFKASDRTYRALLHRSDQGSQYTSEQVQRLLADNGISKIACACLDHPRRG